MSDDEAFMICFSNYERQKLFKILLIIEEDESEIIIDENYNQAIDWLKI